VSFSKIVKEALEIKSEAFVKLVEDATQLLRGEDGKIGNMNITGRLVKVDPVGEALIVGDLHGDLESLVDVFNESNFMQKLDRNQDASIVFLGDYGDRGPFSAEVFYTVLSLKLHHPEHVVLMRGNHEGPEDLTARPNDLPEQFQMRFGDGWDEAHWKVHGLFSCLYSAVLVEERFLMIHGGLPSHSCTLDDLAYAHERHPRQRFLEDMLWSDPSDSVQGSSASPRGAGRLFGKTITEEALERFGVKALIRGHEPCEDGYKIDHDGRILTLFSRKGPPYFNEHGAFLDLELSAKPESAEQLVPYVHRF
jgi:protein phosphatase